MAKEEIKNYVESPDLKSNRYWTGQAQVDYKYQVRNKQWTVDNTPFGIARNGVTNKAPSQDTVYDALNSISTYSPLLFIWA